MSHSNCPTSHLVSNISTNYHMYTLKKGKIKKDRQEGGKGEEEREEEKEEEGPKKNKNQYNQVQDPINVHGIDDVNMSHRYEHEECSFWRDP